MTRDEFINAYMARSNLPREVQRTAQGFSFEEYDSIALPCECDADECYGWAMMPNELVAVALHCHLHTPRSIVLTFHLRCTACQHKWDQEFSRAYMDSLVQHEARCPHCGVYEDKIHLDNYDHRSQHA